MKRYVLLLFLLFMSFMFGEGFIDLSNHYNVEFSQIKTEGIFSYIDLKISEKSGKMFNGMMKIYIKADNMKWRAPLRKIIIIKDGKYTLRLPTFLGTMKGFNIKIDIDSEIYENHYIYDNAVSYVAKSLNRPKQENKILPKLNSTDFEIYDLKNCNGDIYMMSMDLKALNDKCLYSYYKWDYDSSSNECYSGSLIKDNTGALEQEETNIDLGLKNSDYTGSIQMDNNGNIYIYKENWDHGDSNITISSIPWKKYTKFINETSYFSGIVDLNKFNNLAGTYGYNFTYSIEQSDDCDCGVHNGNFYDPKWCYFHLKLYSDYPYLLNGSDEGWYYNEYQHHPGLTLPIDGCLSCYYHKSFFHTGNSEDKWLATKISGHYLEKQVEGNCGTEIEDWVWEKNSWNVDDNGNIYAYGFNYDYAIHQKRCSSDKDWENDGENHNNTYMVGIYKSKDAKKTSDNYYGVEWIRGIGKDYVILAEDYMHRNMRIIIPSRSIEIPYSEFPVWDFDMVQDTNGNLILFGRGADLKFYYIKIDTTNNYDIETIDSINFTRFTNVTGVIDKSDKLNLFVGNEIYHKTGQYSGYYTSTISYYKLNLTNNDVENATNLINENDYTYDFTSDIAENGDIYCGYNTKIYGRIIRIPGGEKKLVIDIKYYTMNDKEQDPSQYIPKENDEFKIKCKIKYDDDSPFYGYYDKKLIKFVLEGTKEKAKPLEFTWNDGTTDTKTLVINPGETEFECPYYLKSTSYFGVVGVKVTAEHYEEPSSPAIATMNNKLINFFNKIQKEKNESKVDKPPIIDCKGLKEIPDDSDDDCISDKWEKEQIIELSKKCKGNLEAVGLGGIDISNIKKEDLEKFSPEWDNDPIIYNGKIFEKGDGLNLKTEYRGYSFKDEPNNFAGRLNAYQPEKFIKYGDDLMFGGKTYTAKDIYGYAVEQIEKLGIKLIDVGKATRAYPYYTTNTPAMGEAKNGFKQILTLNLKKYSSNNNGIHHLYFKSDNGKVKLILEPENGQFMVKDKNGNFINGNFSSRFGIGTYGQRLIIRRSEIYIGSIINLYMVDTKGHKGVYIDKNGIEYPGKYYINSVPKNYGRNPIFYIEPYHQKVFANLRTFSGEFVNIEEYGDGKKDNNIFEMSVDEALKRIPLHEMGHNFSLLHPDIEMYKLRIEKNGPFTPMGEGIGKWVGRQFIEDNEIRNITNLSLDWFLK